MRILAKLLSSRVMACMSCGLGWIPIILLLSMVADILLIGMHIDTVGWYTGVLYWHYSCCTDTIADSILQCLCLGEKSRGIRWEIYGVVDMDIVVCWSAVHPCSVCPSISHKMVPHPVHPVAIWLLLLVSLEFLVGLGLCW